MDTAPPMEKQPREDSKASLCHFEGVQNSHGAWDLGQEVTRAAPRPVPLSQWAFSLACLLITKLSSPGNLPSTLVVHTLAFILSVGKRGGNFRADKTTPYSLQNSVVQGSSQDGMAKIQALS